MFKNIKMPLMKRRKSNNENIKEVRLYNNYNYTKISKNNIIFQIFHVYSIDNLERHY